jgi:hypothetical protein
MYDRSNEGDEDDRSNEDDEDVRFLIFTFRSLIFYIS